ncbi:uncharacterized protein CANTADRAFT_217970 [Suhomyces tanzawaensis NRRL Y-17324]|uniref:Uncharacterized protein n=1 Tax=Suhomyces tanzawaensis NRRL Y-17324 TaxID=984487 RepID=A0A1E4SK13_9ASCO|nr:uncharacterized protein CANTADRAFT_217970 [Suhomyces tanzawaensis NRRL Y-17324]ODV79855.1 hypothetical protein CANTADRAFT_217970 [Suhomyces tanzawaensis NRRL Y-17324]
MEDWTIVFDVCMISTIEKEKKGERSTRLYSNLTGVKIDSSGARYQSGWAPAQDALGDVGRYACNGTSCMALTADSVGRQSYWSFRDRCWRHMRLKRDCASSRVEMSHDHMFLDDSVWGGGSTYGQREPPGGRGCARAAVTTVPPPSLGGRWRSSRGPSVPPVSDSSPDSTSWHCAGCMGLHNRRTLSISQPAQSLGNEPPAGHHPRQCRRPRAWSYATMSPTLRVVHHNRVTNLPPTSNFEWFPRIVAPAFSGSMSGHVKFHYHCGLRFSGSTCSIESNFSRWTVSMGHSSCSGKFVAFS